MFKKTLIAASLAAAVVTPGAFAAEQSPHTLTGNIGLYSQYVFRGLTQTNREPALQGGMDYSHASGFYLGTWASNISWLRDGLTAANTPNPAYRSGGSLEWDFYGGFKGNFGKSDFTYDLGLLYYWYPGDASAGFVKADNTEIYGALGWKWITAKLSYTVSNKMFGVREADGTYYFDLSANVPVTDKLTFNLHWGYQKYTGTDTIGNIAVAGRQLSNDEQWSYKDWKIGLSYALPKDFTIGVFYTKAYDANALGYGNVAQGGVYPRALGDGTATVFLSKTF